MNFEGEIIVDTMNLYLQRYFYKRLEKGAYHKEKTNNGDYVTKDYIIDLKKS